MSHVDCWLSENCGKSDCPAVLTNERRAAERGQEWSKLELVHDGWGHRHYLDGQAVHCGAIIEIQYVASRNDDHGEYSVLLQEGRSVRYEASFITTPPRVSLHAGLGGHEFVAGLEPYMRFRWPA